jgi:hypothetical protein
VTETHSAGIGAFVDDSAREFGWTVDAVGCEAGDDETGVTLELFHGSGEEFGIASTFSGMPNGDGGL